LKSFKSKLLTGTFIPALVGTGVVIGGGLLNICQPRAANPSKTQHKSGALPTAKPRLGSFQVAACNTTGTETKPADQSDIKC